MRSRTRVAEVVGVLADWSASLLPMIQGLLPQLFLSSSAAHLSQSILQIKHQKIQHSIQTIKVQEEDFNFAANHSKTPIWRDAETLQW